MNRFNLIIGVLVLFQMVTQPCCSQESNRFADYTSYSYVCDGRAVLDNGSVNWESVAFMCAWSHENPLDLSVDQRESLTRSLYETQLIHREIKDADLTLAKKFLKSDVAAKMMQESLTDEQIDRLNSWIPGFIVKNIWGEKQLSPVIELISKYLPDKDTKSFATSFKDKILDVLKKLRMKKWEELVESSPKFVKDDFEQRKVKSDYRISLYQQMDFELDQSKADFPGEVKSGCLEKAKEMEIELVEEIKEATKNGWDSVFKSLPDRIKSQFSLKRS